MLQLVHISSAIAQFILLLMLVGLSATWLTQTLGGICEYIQQLYFINFLYLPSFNFILYRDHLAFICIKDPKLF